VNRPRVARRGRVRLQPYVEASLAQRLAALCAARGVTETAVVQEALRQHLEGTSDAMLLLRRLDRLGRELGRVQRDVEILSEAFGIWVKLWFAHTPSVAEDARRAARASAEARYAQYVQHVTEQYARGSRFVDDLPREPLGDEEELAAAARAGEPGEG
jgi:hypothetical protein